MRRTRYAGLAVAMVLSAGVASAQVARPIGLDSATVAAIAPVIQRAQATNPSAVELLYAKAREGQVRRVPLATIESAVRALAGRIQTANDALAPNATLSELEAA